MQEIQETQVQSWGQEDPLEKGTATHSSVLALKPHGQRGLAGCSPLGHKEPDAAEHTLEGWSPRGKPPRWEAGWARRHQQHLFLGEIMKNLRSSLICILPIYFVNSSHTSVWWYNKERLHICSKNYIKSVPKLDTIYCHQQDGKYVPVQTDNAVLYCN